MEGVAGAVPVLAEGQGAAWEFLLHEVRDDGFLVFDGGVVPVQLLVHGDAAVAGDVKAFDHGVTLLYACQNILLSYLHLSDNIVSLSVEKSNRKNGAAGRNIPPP